jgi:hypothetical protein
MKRVGIRKNPKVEILSVAPQHIQFILSETDTSMAIPSVV